MLNIFLSQLSLGVLTASSRYRPDLFVSFIKEQLSFPILQECLEFLEQNGVVFKPGTKNAALDTKASLPSVTENVKTFEKVDIKGQL